MPRKDFVLRGAGVVVVAGVLATGAYVVGGGGGGDTANIWVSSGGGACAGGRSATPIDLAAAASPDRICGSLDTAWDAASAGDTVCVSAGTYASQVVSGNKASTTTIRGCENDPADVTIGDGTEATCSGDFGGQGAFCPQANNLTLENVTIDTNAGNTVAAGSQITGSNVTFRDVDILGDYPQVYVTATGFLWQRGTFGDPSPPHERQCENPGQPLQIDSGDMTIDGIEWLPILVNEADTGGACGGGNPHVENVRIQCNCPVTIKNNFFRAGGESGSGYIFSGITALDSLTVANTYFGEMDVTFYMQAGNLTSCSGWLWLYNTFDDAGMGFSLGSCSGGTSAGNLGVLPPGSCGNHVRNVAAGSGSCGTDTRIGAADFGVDPANGRLEVGSPGIDGGETTPGTYCAGAVVNSLDREGNARGTGGVCDAGSDER